MSQLTTRQSVLFPDLLDKRLVARFDQHHGSSDGGALLLKAADRRLGLLDALAACLPEARQSGKVDHELIEMLSQRVYGLACGYPDCNDAARLSEDPIHKALVGRDPIEGDPLASQSTLSRFENAFGPRILFRFGEALAGRVIERHRKRRRGKARRIVIDLDVTDDATHGAQQLSLFNGFYDTWCYLPLLAFVTFDDEPEQYLCAAILRPGRIRDWVGATGLLRRLLNQLGRAFPQARFLVRLDGGFACPSLLDFLDEQPQVDYLVAFAKNPVLLRRAQRLMGHVRKRSRASGKTEREFGECRYAARRWSHPRRVIIKAEVVRLEGREPRDNPRFVITNLRRTPRGVYQLYRRRGETENRLKELQDGMEIGRTSCSRFWANQFRVLMTTAAYALMQELRLHAARSGRRRAQVATLRDRLIKLGAHVVVSVRRIVLHLPASFPYRDDWRRVALALGARPG